MNRPKGEFSAIVQSNGLAVLVPAICTFRYVEAQDRISGPLRIVPASSASPVRYRRGPKLPQQDNDTSHSALRGGRRSLPGSEEPSRNAPRCGHTGSRPHCSGNRGPWNHGIQGRTPVRRSLRLFPLPGISDFLERSDLHDVFRMNRQIVAKVLGHVLAQKDLDMEMVTVFKVIV